jgi:hypothetical protein
MPPQRRQRRLQLQGATTQGQNEHQAYTCLCSYGYNALN